MRVFELLLVTLPCISSFAIAIAASELKRSKRMALRDRVHLWPNATIPFTFRVTGRDRNLQRISALTQHRVLTAMKIWTKDTCLRFVPWNGEREYAKIAVRSDCVCCSDVGRQLTGVTLVGVGPTCSEGSVLHEVGHLVGLLHTHDRPDRDNHVELLTENIDQPALWNFEKHSDVDVDTRNFPYDFESVMHYHAYAFSANGLPTMMDTQYPLDSSAASIRRRLSRIDVAFVNTLYNCKSARRCVTTFDARQGNFEVPDYFALDKPCTWNFHIRQNERLLLRLNNVHTKMENPCVTDWISIRSIGTRPSDTKMLTKFCGFTQSPIEFRIYAPTVYNTTVRVALSFYSRAPRFHTGFSANYDITADWRTIHESTMIHFRHSKCNMLIATSNGTISSPLLPQFLRNDYPYIPSCYWHLKPPLRLGGAGKRTVFRLDVFIPRVISNRSFQPHEIDALLASEHSQLDSRQCIGTIFSTAVNESAIRFDYECNTDWLTDGYRMPTQNQEFWLLREDTVLPAIEPFPNSVFPRLRKDHYGAKLTFWIEAVELKIRWYSLWHLPFEMHYMTLSL